MNTPQDEVTLGLLNAIEKNGRASQRDLAKHTGVALGLVNSYIKRCVRKGWIKISDAPANRYVYYLTPTGFSEKMRLTTRYISDSFSFYRRAAETCDLMLKGFAESDVRRIALFGISDLAEIVFLKSLENPVEVIAICDPENSERGFFSLPVWRKQDWQQRLSDTPPDAMVLTDILQPDQSFNLAAELFDSEKIFVPEILGGWAGKTIHSEHRVV